MGMLFNGKGTVELLGILNTRYGHADPSDPTAGVANTGDAAVYLGKDVTGAYNYATLMDISDQLGFSTGKKWNTKWKKWLLALESNQQGSITSAIVIREAIGAYLQDGKTTAIEFFAVPDTKISINVSTIPVPDDRNNYYYSRIITVYTVTYDKAHKAALASRAIEAEQLAKPTRRKKR